VTSHTLARPVRRLPLLLTVLAAVLGCLTLAPAEAHATPATPATGATGVAGATGATGATAHRAKQVADHSVASLRKRIAATSRSLARLSAAASGAENDYLAQLAAQQRATAAEAEAATAAAAAQHAYDQARSDLVAVVVSYYESGGEAGNSVGATSAASLFTAPDPGAVIQAGADREMITRFQSQVAAQLNGALAARNVAESRHRQALAQMAAQTRALATIRQRANAALQRARTELAGLQHDLRAAKLTQAQADAALSSFLGGWAVSDGRRAAALDSSYRRLARLVQHQRPAPSHGRWTPAVGQTAANRAIQWIGTPYAWAGGSSHGPTRGSCAGGDAAQDCKVVGFDCSGLAIFGWAPYLSMAHFAATQYTQAGRLHPAVSALRPGDLVFWSSNHSVTGIHHVAVYVGNGNVVQAPQSGDIVRITPLGRVSSGYFGATRPLT
jgi:cell wall-associated NlpC family hydrolase